MRQERVHQRRVRPDRPPHRVTDPDDSLGDVTSGQRYLGLARLVHPALAHRAIVGCLQWLYGRCDAEKFRVVEGLAATIGQARA
jgi:hypothetical protein